MRMKLMARNIKALKPTGKEFSVTDTEIAGFTLRVLAGGGMTYAYVYQDAKGRKRRFTIGPTGKWTPEQARDKAKEVQARVNLGEDPAKDKQDGRANTLGDFITGRYAEWAKANRKSGAHTVARLERALSGDPMWRKTLAELSQWDADRWRTARVKASKRKTAGNRDLACLKGAMSRAVEWRLIPENPFARVRLNREDRRSEIRTLTPEEETALWQALGNREERIRHERDTANAWRRARSVRELPDLRAVEFADYLRPMLTLMLHTGLRRGEAFSIEWRDVNKRDRALAIRGEISKSAQTRTIPLNSVALATLKAWQAQSQSKGLVFPSPKTGTKLDNIQSAWRRILKEAGIAGLRLHDLRHTFATRTLAAGADIATVKELLGHADIATTAKYLHPTRKLKAEAVERIANVTPGNVLPFTAAAGEAQK